MKRLARTGFGICLGLLAFGCGERAANVEHSRTYETDLLTFRYPGNWKISDEQKGEFPRFAVIESPWNTAGSVLLFRADDAMSLEEFIGTYRDFFTLKTDRSGGGGYTEAPSRLGEPREERGFVTVTEKLKVKAGNKDVPCTRNYLRKKSGGYVCFIVEQYPDADLEKVGPGFALVESSLRFGEEPTR